MAAAELSAPFVAAAADDECGLTTSAALRESQAIHRHHPIARSQPDLFRVGLLPLYLREIPQTQLRCSEPNLSPFHSLSKQEFELARVEPRPCLRSMTTSFKQESM